MSTIALGIAILPSYRASFLDSESYEEIVQYVKSEIYEIDDDVINLIADDIRLEFIKALKKETYYRRNRKFDRSKSMF